MFGAYRAGLMHKASQKPAPTRIIHGWRERRHVRESASGKLYGCAMLSINAILTGLSSHQEEGKHKRHGALIKRIKHESLDHHYHQLVRHYHTMPPVPSNHNKRYRTTPVHRYSRMQLRLVDCIWDQRDRELFLDVGINSQYNHQSNQSDCLVTVYEFVSAYQSVSNLV